MLFSLVGFALFFSNRQAVNTLTVKAMRDTLRKNITVHGGELGKLD